MAPKRKSVHFDDEIFLVGDTYVYRGTPLGSKKRREISLKLTSRAAQKDVLRAKALAVEGVANLGHRLGKNSFALIAQKYFESREEEAKDPLILSASSLRESRILLEKHFKPYFQAKRIDEIDQALFSEYCRFKKSQGLNLANHRKWINHFLRWCVSENYLKMRPELRIPKTAIKARRQRVVLTHDQIERLLSAGMAMEHGWIIAYLMMYLLMGMRNTEICRLRWDDVDLEKAGLRVDPMSNRKRKARAVPINEFVLSWMKREFETRTSDWVFPARKSAGRFPHISPDGGIRKPWMKVLKAANLMGDITPHDLRATFETFMHINSDFTDTQREKMAGAAINVQKNIYVTMDVDHLRGLEESVQIAGIAEILGGKTGGSEPKKKAAKRVSPRQKGTISK